MPGYRVYGQVKKVQHPAVIFTSSIGAYTITTYCPPPYQVCQYGWYLLIQAQAYHPFLPRILLQETGRYPLVLFKDCNLQCNKSRLCYTLSSKKAINGNKNVAVRQFCRSKTRFQRVSFSNPSIFYLIPIQKIYFALLLITTPEYEVPYRYSNHRNRPATGPGRTSGTCHCRFCEREIPLAFRNR